MSTRREPERYQTIVIGGGQAGLSVGYHLARQRLPFVILDGNKRIGDSWRQRWDSLRLFTRAQYDSLDGMPFPGSAYAFPTKDEMADYLEAYATRFALPVQSGVKVDRLTRQGSRYVVTAGDRTFEAEHVVVAMANYQTRRIPPFARDLRSDIVQLHSSDYRTPSQLQEGSVLIVGAGNSGAEIAIELARAGHHIWMSGRDTGHVPFRPDGVAGRYLLVKFVLRFVFHRVMTMKTPMGRRLRVKVLSQGTPLIRVKPQDLVAAGVVRTGRTAGIRNGLPILEDGRTLDVANVIWCTGFEPASSWIDLPIFGKDGEPRQDRGRVLNEPGLYFVGRHFLYAMSSSMIHGVGRDAEFVVRTIAARVAAQHRAAPVTMTEPIAVHQ